MRRLLLVLALLVAAPAFAQPTQVQTGSNATTGIGAGGASITFGGALTTGAGRFTVLAVVQTSSFGAANTDFTAASGTNTLTQQCTISQSGQRVRIYTAPNTNAATTFAITHSSGDQFGLTAAALFYMELTNVDTAGTPVNQVDADGAGGNSTAPTDDLANTTAAAFIVGAVGYGFGTLTAAGGWTDVQQATIPAGFAHRFEAGTGNFDPAWSIDFANDWTACAVAIAAATGGGGGTINAHPNLTTIGVGEAR